MFARLAGGSLPGEFLELTGGNQEGQQLPANCWIWSQQSIAAQRKALGCPLFESQRVACSRWRTAAVSHRAMRGPPTHVVLRRPPRLPHIVPSPIPPSAPKMSTSKVPISSADLTNSLSSATTFLEIQQLYSHHGSSFTSAHLALAIGQLPFVATQPQDPQLILLEVMMDRLTPDQLTWSNICSVVWTLGKCGYQCDLRLKEQLRGTFMAKMRRQALPEDSGCLAQAAAGFAAMDWKEASLWQPLVSTAEKFLSSIPISEVVVLIQALAAVGGPYRSFFAKASLQCGERLEELSVEELVSLVWSLASAGQHDEELFDRVARLLVQQIEAETSLGLSDCAWAYATLEKYDPLLCTMMLYKDYFKARHQV